MILDHQHINRLSDLVSLVLHFPLFRHLHKLRLYLHLSSSRGSVGHSYGACDDSSSKTVVRLRLSLWGSEPVIIELRLAVFSNRVEGSTRRVVLQIHLYILP
jgi:hypothetical protein